MHFQACSLYVIGCGSEFLHVVIKQGALDHMNRASFDVNYRFSHVLVDVAKISLCEKCVTCEQDVFSSDWLFSHKEMCTQDMSNFTREVPTFVSSDWLFVTWHQQNMTTHGICFFTCAISYFQLRLTIFMSTKIVHWAFSQATVLFHLSLKKFCMFSHVTYILSYVIGFTLHQH